ncbi:MAG: complex I subunit 1 family protein [Myxococcota bacterium]
MMTLAELLLSIVKIAIILGFILNFAGLSVWADRRQSAMVQHRVGPNRAVVTVPTLALRLAFVGGAVAVGGALAAFFWWDAPGHEQSRVALASTVAVGVTWSWLLGLSSHVRDHGANNGFESLVGARDPRVYFYAGVVAHVAVFVVVNVLLPAPGTAAAASSPAIVWGPGLAGTLAAAAILVAAVSAAWRLPDGRTELRLAGTLHAVADTVKAFLKEDLTPKRADRLLYGMAPLISMTTALVTVAVVPFGSSFCFEDQNGDGHVNFAELGALADVTGPTGACPAGYTTVPFQIADLDIGLLFIFAVAGTGIIGAALAGWASDSKPALLGGLRATSQMVSYEVALGLAIVGMLMVCGTVNLREIVDWQGQNTWGIFAQPLAFILFFASAVAETKRIPFDLPEGESELGAGYFIEYSGGKWLLFMVGEYAEFVFSSALIVTLFFGGYHLPFLRGDGIHVAFGDTVLYQASLSHLTVTVLHFFAFCGKTVGFVFFHLFIRWTLPRFRYDQLMKLGWTRLLPLTLVNILGTGAVLLAIDAASPRVAAVVDLIADLSQGVIAAGGMVLGGLTIRWLLAPPRRQRVVVSTTAKLVDAAGGVKPSRMQA